MTKGYVYILECCDGTYYTGSTKHLEKRLQQHQNGQGANYTRKKLPVTLVYVEEYNRIDHAFYREKQIQGWSRKKKQALIEGRIEDLHFLSECVNYTHFKNFEKWNNTLRLRSGYNKGIIFGHWAESKWPFEDWVIALQSYRSPCLEFIACSHDEVSTRTRNTRRVLAVALIGNIL